eukprot:COSAG02_NODE_398_length_23118_cov_49.968939_17_plen_58_part_00
MPTSMNVSKKTVRLTVILDISLESHEDVIRHQLALQLVCLRHGADLAETAAGVGVVG